MKTLDETDPMPMELARASVPEPIDPPTPPSGPKWIVDTRVNAGDLKPKFDLLKAAARSPVFKGGPIAWDKSVIDGVCAWDKAMATNRFLPKTVVMAALLSLGASTNSQTPNWELTKGASPSAYPSEAACVAAATAQGVAQYQCRPFTAVTVAAPPPPVPVPGGTGLLGTYYSGVAMAGAAVLTRTEAVDADWGIGSPGAGVPVDNFSVRWSGLVEAGAAGAYRFQTLTDDGIRVYVNDALVINNWTDHAPATDISAVVTLTAAQKAPIRIEYYEKGGGAVARLRWQPPGAAAFVPIPAGALYPVAYVPPVVVPPPPPPPPTAGGESILSHGGICNGSANNTDAINRAIAAARGRNVPVIIPAGVCAYGNVIELDGVKMRGSGDASVLHALSWERESIFMRGDGAEVSNLKLAGVKAPARGAPWEQTRIALFGARNFLIDNVTIEGSAAAGIQTAQGAGPGRITNNRVRDTLSDSIHLTGGANNIVLEGNLVERSGDDGIAVVSYRYDGSTVHHITARRNTIRDSRWGRNMSVVGGEDVLYENNVMDGNPNWACLYIAQEASYNTFPVARITAQHNTLRNCGSQNTGHAAIMAFSDGAPNADITLTRNDVVQTGQPGIRIYGPQDRVKLDSNRVTGASPALNVLTPGVSVIPYTTGPVGVIAGINPANVMIVSDASGAGLTDHPLTFGRPFLPGEINGAPLIYADGVPIETQAEIEQRWQDGSVRYAVFSVILARLAPGGSTTLTFGVTP